MSSNLHFKVQIGTLTIATTKTFWNLLFVIFSSEKFSLQCPTSWYKYKIDTRKSLVQGLTVHCMRLFYLAYQQHLKIKYDKQKTETLQIDI